MHTGQGQSEALRVSGRQLQDPNQSWTCAIVALLSRKQSDHTSLSTKGRKIKIFPRNILFEMETISWNHQTTQMIMLSGKAISCLPCSCLASLSIPVLKWQVFRERREGKKKNPKARWYKYDCQIITYKDIRAMVACTPSLKPGKWNVL